MISAKLIRILLLLMLLGCSLRKHFRTEVVVAESTREHLMSLPSTQRAAHLQGAAVVTLMIATECELKQPITDRLWIDELLISH